MSTCKCLKNRHVRILNKLVLSLIVTAAFFTGCDLGGDGSPEKEKEKEKEKEVVRSSDTSIMGLVLTIGGKTYTHGTDFTFDDQDEGKIMLPSGTDISNWQSATIESISLATGASSSEETALAITNGRASFAVTAEDTTTDKTYTLILEVEPGDIETLELLVGTKSYTMGIDFKFDIEDAAVVMVPYSTNLNTLTAATVNSIALAAGATSATASSTTLTIDGNHRATITVTPQGGTAKTYTIDFVRYGDVETENVYLGPSMSIIKITPKNGDGVYASFAIPRNSAIPAYDDVKDKPAYRELTLTKDTSYNIQFAITTAATRNDDGLVELSSANVLRHSTAYDVILYYKNELVGRVHNFTTKNNERSVLITNSDISYDVSSLNFAVNTDGNFKTPFVLSRSQKNVSGGTGVFISKNGIVLAEKSTTGSIVEGEKNFHKSYTSLLNDLLVILLNRGEISGQVYTGEIQYNAAKGKSYKSYSRFNVKQQ